MHKVIERWIIIIEGRFVFSIDDEEEGKNCFSFFLLHQHRLECLWVLWQKLAFEIVIFQLSLFLEVLELPNFVFPFLKRYTTKKRKTMSTILEWRRIESYRYRILYAILFWTHFLYIFCAKNFFLTKKKNSLHIISLEYRFFLLPPYLHTHVTNSW